ncbi:MAG: hypothetical protein ABIN73_04290 [candidate division WOR-3 bacterium]
MKKSVKNNEREEKLVKFIKRTISKDLKMIIQEIEPKKFNIVMVFYRYLTR